MPISNTINEYCKANQATTNHINQLSYYLGQSRDNVHLTILLAFNQSSVHDISHCLYCLPGIQRSTDTTPTAPGTSRPPRVNSDSHFPGLTWSGLRTVETRITCSWIRCRPMAECGSVVHIYHQASSLRPVNTEN